MKNKNNIIIFGIFTLIICVTFLICFYCFNIELIHAITISVLLLTFIVALCVPFRIAQKKEQLLDELFIVDIFNKNNNEERIRITEKNVLFKYKSVIKYNYIFPKIFSSISLRKYTSRTPTYNIIGKTQLTIDELNEITEKINKLNNNEDGDTIINFKGNKKFVDRKEIMDIFQNYFK